MIKAPFNFVPLSDKVYLPEWANLISHDVPFEDGEDGTITVHITNHTPLFVRDGHAKDKKTEWSSHIIDDQGNKRYFIPGTTLKGCFRSVMEILSFAKMSRFNNDSFGFRSFTTQEKELGYQGKVSKVKDCGWLSKVDDGYYIRECSKRIQKIRHSDIKVAFPSFNKGRDHETAECKQRSLSKDELYPIFHCNGDIYYNERDTSYRVPNGKYRVVCTGYMNGKKVEYLFSEEQSNPVKVDDEVFRMFDTVHKNTPYYAGLNGKEGFLRKRLMSGESIPVFYEKNAKGEILAIGVTHKIKYPHRFSVSDCVKHVSSDHFGNEVDMPEAIFGYISDNSQLRGRVHIGNAFVTSIVADETCKLIVGVLGQPRASYHPLYLLSEKGKLQNYSSESPKISGRKRYRIIQGKSTLELAQGNDNENVMTKFRPIPSGQTFICKIRVHNLKKCEIGALLSAITFNLTENTYHNIGQAKSFGYGKVSCKAELDGFNYSIEEYVNCFDEEISSFLQKRNSKLKNELSLGKLVQIASATHTKEEMTQMTLEEYKAGKEDRNFKELKETYRNIHIGIDEDAALKRKARQILDSLVIQHLNEIEAFKGMMVCPNDFVDSVNSAVESLNDLESKIKKIDDAISEINVNLTQFEDLVISIDNRYSQLIYDWISFDELVSKARNKRKDLTEQKSSIQSDFKSCIEQLKKLREKITTTGRIQNGLSFLTDKNINGEYKITTIANGSGRIEQFLKKNKDYVISNRDKDIVKEWFGILKDQTMKNNDRRDFQNYDGKSWNKIRQIFGEESAQQWFNEITGK